MIVGVAMLVATALWFFAVASIAKSVRKPHHRAPVVEGPQPALPVNAQAE